MKLGEFLDRIKDLPPDTIVCVAEVDEAAAANVAAVEIVDSADAQGTNADGTEEVALEGGSSQAVVIRW